MAKELIIPVYLNQRNVFDLIAMMQDGLATVTKIDTVAEGSSGVDGKISSNFGLNKAISSLFKVDISASVDANKSQKEAKSKSEERYHTPASMLYVLRNKMIEDKILTVVDETTNPEVGDIIEFSATLKKNPLIHIMEKSLGVMNIAIAFDNGSNNSKKNKNKYELLEPKKQMENFLKFLDESNTIDIIASSSDFEYRSVITLEKEFLNDANMSDLMDGKFKIIGKIIRVIEDNEGSIDLQRKAPVGAMPPEALVEHFSGFYDTLKDNNLNVPDLEFEIKGPALHILPIAVFA